MPQRRAAKRALRKSERARVHNIILTGKMKQAVKKFKTALAAKNNAESKKSLQELYTVLDKAAAKKLIHPNKAARQKSRLTKALNKTAKA